MAGGWPLLEQFLSHALERVRAGMPRVVTLAGDPALGQLPTRWDSESADSVEGFVSTVERRLADGPVVALPPWERMPPGAVATLGAALGMANPGMHEVILADCRPVGPESVLAAFVPAAMLTGSRTGRLRMLIGQQWHPALVIYGSGLMPNVHSSFESAAVVFRCRPAAHAPVRIFRIPRHVDGPEVEADLVRLLGMGGGRSTYGYVLRTPVPPGDSLAFDRHDPAVHRRRTALAEFGRTTRLGDLFTSHCGPVRPTVDAHLLQDSFSDGRVRILAGRDVQRAGTVGPPDEHTRWAELPPERCLRSGDLLIRSLHARTDPAGLVVAEVSIDDLPAAATEHVTVLRPVPELSRHQRLIAMQFLRLPLARTLATDGIDQRIRPSTLLELPVPQPDGALAKALSDLDSAAAQLDKGRSDAVALVESALTDEPATARAQLLESVRLLRMRADAAGLLDDFAYTVRTRFPHPIAYRWRRVEAEMGSDMPRQAYEAVLEAAEMLLTYTANLAIVMARNAGVEITAVNAIREKLTSGRSGPAHRRSQIGWWPRACACLIRLALEHGIDDYWQRARPPVAACASRRAKLLMLRRRRTRALGQRAALSRAAHHHCYELAPTATELRHLHTEVTEILADLRTHETSIP